MAKSTTHVSITLELNRSEAIWLRAYLQNSLHPLSPEDEGEYTRQQREAIFAALPSIQDTYMS